jgi:hypothetical protein
MPNPHPKKPPSIDDKTLEVHINEWCMRLDNNKSYDDFVELMESPIEPKIPNIMRVFKIGRSAAITWKGKYEQQKADATS